MKRRALISVSDKTGVVEFARRLDALNFELVSTGGTAKVLRAGGLQVTSVSDITGFPECLDGRLKTIHPAIAGGLLAVRGNTEHRERMESLGIGFIDVLVINLYPFKQTVRRQGVSLEEAIENIDIGGPTLLRAAAKNWQDVLVLTSPEDYGEAADALESGYVPIELKFKLAAKVFELTAHYDALIAEYLRGTTPALMRHPSMGGELGENISFPQFLTLTYERAQELRYGENPHQPAMFYRDARDIEGTTAGFMQHWGMELSYNNIQDLDGAVCAVKEFDIPCAVAVKHATPCGVGWGSAIDEAFIRARDADPQAIYGGIVALNRPCSNRTAELLVAAKLDIIAAPLFTDKALETLKQRKNHRVLTISNLQDPINPHGYTLRRVLGGLLHQSVDAGFTSAAQGKVVTHRAPTPDEITSLDFAMRVCKHVKSNAIVLVNGQGTVGIGPGQLNRIGALDIAVKNAGDRTVGAVMASDAYFPFHDCVETAHANGITAIVQPGGSVRDAESIELCDQHDIAMIFTGLRHFRH